MSISALATSVRQHQHPLVCQLAEGIEAIWEENLEPRKFPQEKIIKTLIYGIKSSGNQAEYALRQTALASKSEYPEANRIIQKDVYVDDCLSGANTKEKVTQLADEIQIILSRGGFTLKGFTFRIFIRRQ